MCSSDLSNPVRKSRRLLVIKAKFTILGHHVATSVYLRGILGDFPDTEHQELPGA